MIKTIKSLNLENLFIYFLTAFVILGVYIRFQGLGYSEFQGDEIDTVEFVPDIYGEAPSYSHFFTKDIYENKKGPVQYAINFVNIKSFPGVSEFKVRLPYFIFSFLSFFAFFYLARKIFPEKIAAYATVAIYAMNGLQIAFSRITQYQALMFLLQPLAVLLFLKGYYGKNVKLLLLSAGVFGLAFLTHYDALVLFAFFYSFLFIEVLKDKKNLKRCVTYAVSFTAVFALISIPFYIGYVNSRYFSKTTSGYLNRRLWGFGLMPRVPVVLNVIIHLYMPKVAWLMFFLLTTTSFLPFYKNFSDLKLSFIKIKKWVIVAFYVFMVNLLSFAVIFSNFPIKPRAATLLVYGSSISIIITLLWFHKKIKTEIISLIIWFLFAFNVYFFFIKDPRTHVYISMIPAFILAGYGVSVFWNLIKNSYYKIVVILAVSLSLFYILVFNWQVFVNKNPEYPWFQKEIFGSSMYVTPKEYHNKVEGVFGFNNRRHWREVRDLYDRGCLVGRYNSNEKNSVTSFYLGENQKADLVRGLVVNSPTLIVIEGPHSWMYRSPSKQPDSDYLPIISFKNNDLIVMQIWGHVDTYPEGKLLCN